MPSKEYYLKNKEEIKHKGKIYREKHKVQRNAYFQSESYKKHKKAVSYTHLTLPTNREV